MKGDIASMQLLDAKALVNWKQTASKQKYVAIAEWIYWLSVSHTLYEIKSAGCP